MYLSITNVGHKKTKYFIVDQSEELNLPNIPLGYNLVFQEKYTNNIKVINDDEFKEIFKNNTLLYEIVEFNSSFKISNTDALEYIDTEYENINKNFLKSNESLTNNGIIYYENNKLKCLNNIYNKNEFDSLTSLLQNKINKIRYDINLINTEKGKIEKSNIFHLFEEMKNNLNLIKRKIRND